MEHCLQAARSTLILYPLFLLFLSYCFGLPSRGSRHLQSYTNNSYHTPNWEQAAATTAAITATAAETEVATTAAAAQNSTIWKLINQSRSNGQLHTTPPLLNIGEQLNSSLPKKQNGFKWNYRKSFKDLYTALVLNDQAHGRKGSIVIFTDIESRSCKKPQKNVCLYFNIRKNIANLTFSRAVLWLPRYDKKLSIRQLHGRQSRKLRPLFPRRKNWLRFDILSFVNDWLTQGRQTQGIEVLFRPDQNSILQLHKDGQDPFIVLNIRSRQKRRINKRPPRKCSDNEDSCCLANLTVNFADIGYNEFILNPSYIRVNYCKGDCDLTQGFEDGLNNVSIRQSLIRHSTNVTLNKLIAPCCVPIRYDAHNIQYTIDGEIYKGTIREMSIAECGCR